MKNTRKLTPALSLLLLCATAALGPSCGTEPEDLGLRGAAEDEGAEAERLRRMMAIRVIDASGNTIDKTEAEIGTALDVQCRDRLTADPSALCAPSMDACASKLCDTMVNICGVHAALEIAGIRSGSFRIVASGVTWDVPPQTAAANVSIGNQAVYRAGLAYSIAINSLYDASTAGSSSSRCSRVSTDATFAGATTAGGVTRASRFSSSVVEAYGLGREARFRLVEVSIAAGDAQQGLAATPDVARARALVGAQLSRAAAAHLLIGGAPGLYGSTSVAPWDAQALSPGAESAKRAFREAGVPPRSIAGSSTLEVLVAGPLPPDGSLRERLGELWAAPTMSSATTIDLVSANLRVERNDWLEARDYLKDEIRAFGRSELATLPPRILPGGASPVFKRFAGTAAEPALPPAPYYTGVARRRATTLLDERSCYMVPGVYCNGDPMLVNLLSEESKFVDAGLYFAAAVIAREEALTPPVAGLTSDALGPLSLLLAEGQTRRPGRIEVCYRKPNTTQFVLSGTAQGYGSTAGVILVAGADGLRCAVEGSIEGAACTVSAHRIAQYNTPGTALVGFGVAATAADSTVTIESTPDPLYSTVADNTPIFAVRPKPGTIAGDVGTPGTYEALAGMFLQHTTAVAMPATTIQYCQYLPVMPDLDAKVEELLAPNPLNLSENASNCAGLDQNMAIPLEDELSSDGDAIENSWRHYLTLARQAADEADALGEKVIEDGLTLDVRAEDALAELQDVCGADIDTSGLVDPTLSGMRPATPTTCSTDASCSGTGDRCIGGRCQRDPLAYAASFPDDPQFNRLRLCLGDDTVVPYASLGTQKLCIWRRTTDPTHFCEGTGTVGYDCPRPAKPDGTCDSTWPMPTPPAGVTYAWTPVDQRLGFFDDAALTQAPTSPVPCDAIRALRSNVIPGDETRESLMRRIQASNEFNKVSMDAVAARVGWEAQFGSFSRLTLDGATWVTTGSTFAAPPTSGWPCTSAPSSYFECVTNVGTTASPVLVTDSTSLFCMAPINCATREGRARVNSRWMRAALSASLHRAGPIRLPYVTPDEFALIGEPAARRQLPVTATWLTSTPIAGWYQMEVLSTDVPTLDVAWTYPLDPAGTTFDYTLTGATSRFFATTKFEWGRAEAGVRLLNHANAWRGMGPRTGFAGLTPRTFAVSGTYSEMLFYNTRPFFGASLPSRDLPVERDYDYDPEALLDGLELMCEAARSGVGGCDVNTPPSVTSYADLRRVQRFLGCVADGITRQSGSTIVYGLPTRALDAMRTETASGAYPQLGGEHGAAVSSLRGALVDAAAIAPLIADELRQTGDDMERLRLELASADNQDNIAQVQFVSTVANQLAACGSSSTYWGAIATCANSIAQISFADSLTDLSMTGTDIGRQLSINQFRTDFGNRMTSLQNHASQLRAAQERIDSQLATIERLRNQGRRALSRALFGGTDAGTKQLDTAATIRRRLNTQRMRYEDAHKNAIRMSFLARRAIEQRLGMSLSRMTDDMAGLAAPSTWESSVCASTGFDFDVIRDGTSATTNYADAYIGDYVSKLEQLVEAYRIEYPFHEAEDTVVFSLRDEVQNIRDICEVSVNNSLSSSAALDAVTTTGAGGWRRVGCGLTPGGAVVPNCVSAARLSSASIAAAYPELGAAVPHRVSFGAPLREDVAPFTAPTTCPVGSTTCGLRAETRLAQPQVLGRGRYRLSWYARAVPSGPAGAIAPALAGGVFPGTDATGVELTHTATQTQTVAGGGGWSRYYYIFDVSTAGTYWVALKPAVTGTMLSQSIDVAALMLEDVTIALPGAFASVPAASPPAPFVATGTEGGLAQLAKCEDTDGDVFRSNAWRRECVNLCPDGYGSECGGALSQSACYWETSFSLHGRDIEGGHILNNAGFARGNYNYRVDTVAVNAVGTAARSCTDTDLPSTCYNAGFVPFSLYQRGPFIVRNHRGEDYNALLSTGVIEHARALADESYLSNPLSAASASRVEAFTRAELRGRPLDGSYVLRIWDEAGVNFDGIEDIQIVLRYRYWTRNDI